ncbi:MAG: 30S ribosomal protein S12 methylthiotransferase RimO [Candidatus Brocadiia bacterium]
MVAENYQQARVAIISLGCAKNLIDSEHIASLLEDTGVEVCSDPAAAQVAIVNTCGFIDIAKEESIEVILEAAAMKKTSDLHRLIVTGCLSERYGEELRESLPEADILLGIDPHGAARAALWALGKGDVLPSRCNMRACRFTPRAWTYLRIAEGCSNRCSYCAIPDIRGPLVSRPMGEILDEAEGLLESGVRELNIIAQDTTAYGQDEGDPRLHELLQTLAWMDSGHWIRLLYTHPAHYYPQLIDVLAGEESICPYLDIPFQHISNPVLERMGRNVSRMGIQKLLDTLRDRISNLVLRTTFIVGFPGETEEDFTELLDFVREQRFDRMGVFRYSCEDETPAGRFENQVPEDVKQERYDELMHLQMEIAFEKASERIGESVKVLVEPTELHPEKTPWGRSRWEAPDVDPIIFLQDTPGLQDGEMVDAKIMDSRDYDCVARVLEGESEC